MNLVITIPESDFVSLGLSESQARLDLAVFFYTEWQMPPGKCAKFAKISKVVFLDELGKRKIPIHYDLSALDQDVQNWKNFTLNDGGH